MPASPLRAAENIDVLFPCLALVDVEVMGMRGSQSTKHLVWISSHEPFDLILIVGGGAERRASHWGKDIAACAGFY